MYPKLSLQEAVVVKDDNKNEVADIVPSNKAGYVARGNLSYTTHPGARLVFLIVTYSSVYFGIFF